MSHFKIYKQSVKTVHGVADFVNANGWTKSEESDDLAVKLKVATLDLFEPANDESLKVFNDAISGGVLQVVGMIECDSPEDAFFATQSGDACWTTNKKVNVFHSNEDMFYNSACTGDVFECIETGVKYLTLAMGFQEF